MDPKEIDGRGAHGNWIRSKAGGRARDDDGKDSARKLPGIVLIEIRHAAARTRPKIASPWPKKRANSGCPNRRPIWPARSMANR